MIPLPYEWHNKSLNIAYLKSVKPDNYGAVLSKVETIFLTHGERKDHAKRVRKIYKVKRECGYLHGETGPDNRVCSTILTQLLFFFIE